MHHRSLTYKIFLAVNNIFLLLLGLLCLAPLIHILAVSFSSPAAASANIVGLWPVNFTIDAYMETLGNDNFLRSFYNGVKRTIIGTIVSMSLMTVAAYALSKEENEFKGRTFYTWFFL